MILQMLGLNKTMLEATANELTPIFKKLEELKTNNELIVVGLSSNNNYDLMIVDKTLFVAEQKVEVKEVVTVKKETINNLNNVINRIIKK